MRLLKAAIAVAFLICPLAAKADSLDFHAINPGGVGWAGVYNFASGGNITVSGCGSTCFSGNFTQGELLFDAGDGTATFVGNFIAGQPDSSFFGKTNANDSISASFANVSAPLTGDLEDDWASDDPTLTPVPNPVPEPPAIVLLGFGLIGLVLLAKK